MFVVIKGRKLLKGAASIVVAIALIAVIAVYGGKEPEKTLETAAIIDSWGLRFEENGQAPIGNKSSEYLAEFNSYYINKKNSVAGEKVIYLTFDAGFENGNTPKILDTLKKHDVKATFFLVGNYLSSCPDLVKQMADEGHLVGNHTFSHPDMSKILEQHTFKKELESLEKMYVDITGKEMPKLYRPPAGKFSESNLKHAKDLGYKTFFWGLAYKDWYVDNQPTKGEAFAKLLPRTHPGVIVLLHSNSKTNADILDELLTKWKEMGYMFGSLLDF